MSPQVQELLTKAMNLSPGERAELSDLLIETLDVPGESVSEDEWAQAWGPEIERRLQAYERGETKGQDWREALDEIRQSLHQSPVQ
jgi:putative addiction module component (TIGR02574 family)